MTARRLAPLWPLAAAALLASAHACTRAEDKVAKARIFSPEEPQGSQAEAMAKLDARRLADDAALARRALRMERGEVAHRLGAHKARTHVQFQWTRGATPDGGSPEAALAEEATLTQTRGPEFQVRLSNDRGGGWELVRAAGGVYVRSLPGPFRKRRTDRSDPESLREKALGALATFDRFARGLKLKLDGETKVGTRPALRYSVIGSDARPSEEDLRDLPPVQYPEPPAGQAGRALGPDPDTARRLELLEKEQPLAVSGTVTVDAETAAPLAADLTGRFRVAPARPGQPPADLDLKVALATSEIGGAFEVKAPAYEPDPSTPHAVKDPLRFLGRTGAAGGAPSTAEPVEDDEGEIPQ